MSVQVICHECGVPTTTALLALSPQHPGGRLWLVREHGRKRARSLAELGLGHSCSTGGCLMESAAPRAGLCRRLNRSSGVSQAS